MTDAKTERAWAVSGSYFEACNCEAICPCRSVGGRPGGRSTEGICQFALSWHIRDGHADDLDLSGLDVVMAGFYDDDEPGQPWQVCLYIDENASDAQYRWVSDIFLGRVNGTTRDNFAAAIHDVCTVRRARLDLGHELGHWRIGAEGHVRVTAHELVTSDETVACGIPGHDHPGQELRAEVLVVHEPPLDWEVTGRCAFATSFDYRSAD